MEFINDTEKSNKGTANNACSHEYNNHLIKGLEAYFPDLVTRLRYPGNPEMIQKIEEEVGEQLPESFKELYMQFDGENSEYYTGTILGLSLLDAETILNTIKEFKKIDFCELTSMNTGVISEAGMKERILIPFAFDDSRCYIALDLSPDINGTKGQVITLDYDYDTCYLLADSLEHFYDFVLRMMKEKKCTVNTDEEEAYFEFETGHLFNVLDDLLSDSDNSSADIVLPENFWQNYFQKKTVSANVLQKEKRCIIKNETISFTPLIYMGNLRELIIHNSTIEDFSAIIHASELRKIFLVGCQFDEADLEALSKLPNLKELHLGCMDVKDIQCLANAPSLKVLGLRKLEQFHTLQSLATSKSLKRLELEDLPQINISELEHFDKLQELLIKGIKIENLNFLQNMKDIKKLEIPEAIVENLDFLENLKKLTIFELKHKAKEESGLRFLTDLKKLKQFNYPVADLKFYEKCEKLEMIGIDVVHMHNEECLRESNIHNVQLYGVKSEAEVEQVVKKLSQYITLQCWSHNII